MTISIAANGNIIVDGHNTGFGVEQDSDFTRVFSVINGAPVRLPGQRYVLISNNPINGVPGLIKFEADLRPFI
jgi:hypothetical protein